MVGRGCSGECTRALGALKETCSMLGMPFDDAKEDGPAEVVTFLGIEVDTMNMEIRLLQAKLGELQNMLKLWRGMKSCRKRDLQSILTMPAR